MYHPSSFSALLFIGARLDFKGSCEPYLDRCRLPRGVALAAVKPQTGFSCTIHNKRPLTPKQTFDLSPSSRFRLALWHNAWAVAYICSPPLLYFTLTKQHERHEAWKQARISLQRLQSCTKRHRLTLFFFFFFPPLSLLHFPSLSINEHCGAARQPVCVHWCLAPGSGLCWSSNGFEKYLLEFKCRFNMGEEDLKSNIRKPAPTEAALQKNLINMLLFGGNVSLRFRRSRGCRGLSLTGRHEYL